MKQEKKKEEDIKDLKNQPDGEDLSALEDDTSQNCLAAGKHRYDTLIKTMIARLEYNNTLAPV